VAARRRPLWIAGLDAASLALFAASSALVLAQLGHVPPLAWWPLVAAAALAGVCAADLATGATHWLFDRFFDETTLGVGPVFVRPFREHHRDPGAIARHGLLEVCGNGALALAPLLWACAVPARAFGRDLAATGLLSFALAGIAAAFATNLLHRWAHAERAPRAVRWLQRRRLVLPPDEHARHHRGAHDRAFCVTTGWMNPLLDALGVFEALEHALRSRAPRRSRS
jgi:ubiquitin-conjugating enzyme E2 variant